MAYQHEFTFDNESELKQAFAALFMRYGDPFKAALELFKTDTPRALWVAMNWKDDGEVLQLKTMLSSDDDMALLPTKFDAALAVWKLFEDDKLTAFERIAAWDRYAAIRGFIEKPSTGVTVNVNENKVMLVTDHGNRDDWARKLAKQQHELTTGNYIEHDATAN